MNKYILTSLLLIICVLNLNAQNNERMNKTVSIENRYMNLNSFKKTFERKLTKNDSLNFRIVKNDTLVLLTKIDENKFKTFNFEYKDETFLNLYKKIAFNKKSKSKNDKYYLKYWEKPLNIYFSESISKKRKRSFENFIKTTLKGIDSLQINIVKNINESNYIIYLKGDFQYCKNIENLNHDYYISWENSKINKGYIKIDDELYFNDNLFNYSLNKLFIQSLGHFSLTDELNCNNYFSICQNANKEFSKLDYEILKYHYSYGICKGIDEEAFDNLHQKAKEHKNKFPNIPYKISHTED